MIINGPDGKSVEVTPDARVKTLAAVEPFMHVMSEIGQAWTLPFKVTAADTTDNVVFHLKNTSDETLDIHYLKMSSTIGGLWTVEYGKTYSSGGTAILIRQLNTLSGKTQDLTAYYGADMTLAGTGTDLIYMKSPANTPIDLLADSQSLQVEPSAVIAIRFQADSGTPVIAGTVFLHGEEPWE